MPALWGGTDSATISALSDFSRPLPRFQSLPPGGWVCAPVLPLPCLAPPAHRTHTVHVWELGHLGCPTWIASLLAHALRFAASLAAWRSPWRAYGPTPSGNDLYGTCRCGGPARESRRTSAQWEWQYSAEAISSLPPGRLSARARDRRSYPNNQSVATCRNQLATPTALL